MAAGGVDERRQGVVTEWNDARGFGFIAPASGTGRVFVHVSAFPRSRRPTVGCGVTYVEVRDERRGATASAVHYLSATSTRGPRGQREYATHAIAALFLSLVATLVALDELAPWVLGMYGLMSAVALLSYRADKAAAVRGGWRTSESTLHGIALLGGWPGALVARHVFRHKTTKQPFRAIFWCTAVANTVALAWLVVVR